MHGFEVTKLIMLRITILWLLLVEAFLIVKAEKYTNYSLNNSVTECNKIEGDMQGCYECYMCNGDVFKSLTTKRKRTYSIKLFDNSCQPQAFCCFSQQDVTARNTENCGKSEPAGYPRSIRESLRSVLQGQYPWRTWIFSAGSTKPLCAAVYINHAKRAVITSATCVKNYTPQLLRVGFTRTNGNIRVKEIHKYDYDTRSNDIVLLALSQNDALSPWAHPACLPSSRPLFAISCIAISDQDLYLNTVVPSQSSCVIDKQLDETKLCARVAKGDYVPEVGGGLFCEQETSLNDINYVVNGIHLYQTNNVSFYTNTSHYISWIEKTIDGL